MREREVGFVFQHYALFRHMTVFENIAFGLRVRPRATRPNEEIKARNPPAGLGAAGLFSRPAIRRKPSAGKYSALPWRARWRVEPARAAG